MIRLPGVLTTLVDPMQRLSSVWFQWADGVTKQLSRDWGVGATAGRPTGTSLNDGDTYFDTTLGLPIWYYSGAWIKADGTPA